MRRAIALRVYPTPSAPLVLDGIVLVGAIAGLLFPVAPLLLLLLAIAAMLRRFVVVDPQARQIRVVWGHPLSPLATGRYPLEAPIRVRARAVREVTRNTSGSVIASAEHEVQEVCVGDQAVTRTRSEAYASELAAQLAYAVDGGATLPAAPWSRTRLLDAARLAIALLSMLAILARPLLATTQLASSLALPLGSLAGESFAMLIQATGMLCIVVLGIGLGPKLARLTGHPCEDAAVRRQPIVAALGGAVLGLGAAVLFGGSSALASWVDGQSRAERFASFDRGATAPAAPLAPGAPVAPPAPPAPPPPAIAPARPPIVESDDVLLSGNTVMCSTGEHLFIEVSVPEIDVSGDCHLTIRDCTLTRFGGSVSEQGRLTLERCAMSGPATGQFHVSGSGHLEVRGTDMVAASPDALALDLLEQGVVDLRDARVGGVMISGSAARMTLTNASVLTPIVASTAANVTDGGGNTGLVVEVD